MIEVLTTTDSQKLLHQLNALLEQELRCQPKVCGLRLIESTHDNGLRMTARLRDLEVKDLLSLTQFFGFDTETFSLAVNLLDRFLSKMKVCLKLHYPEYFMILLNVFWTWYCQLWAGIHNLTIFLLFSASNQNVVVILCTITLMNILPFNQE